MFTIEQLDTKALRADPFSRSPAGEIAHVPAEGIELHQGLATLFPKQAILHHLTSRDGRHLYSLTVRGATVAQFVAVAHAYGMEDFEEAERLVTALRPQDNSMN